jgi:hypothetical protein
LSVGAADSDPIAPTIDRHRARLASVFELPGTHCIKPGTPNAQETPGVNWRRSY